MSWRSIEMQVALPRTQDVGKLQEQQMKQPQHFQESLAGIQLKQQVMKRKQVNKLGDTEKIKKENNTNDELQNRQEKKEQQLLEKEVHPFLGQRIDFNG
ncbi:hypothetical protein [Oceanobacillus manasiensis]|uniref:hypothetical protein n=1 Tax=Oceanobacillus manasiensis TaxID=586413 RepID=UPI0005A78F37|nr:hypothetical protein [Oceanobacillus manasiensis]